MTVEVAEAANVHQYVEPQCCSGAEARRVSSWLPHVSLLVVYNLWIFASLHQDAALVQGLLNLVFFLYLVRPEVRDACAKCYQTTLQTFALRIRSSCVIRGH